MKNGIKTMSIQDRMEKVTEFWKRYKRNKAGVFGLLIISLVFFLALAASVLTPYPPLKTLVGPVLQAPFRAEGHPLGTDNLGRDWFSMLIHSTRAALVIGFAVSIFGSALGILIGIPAGYYGGLVDDILMRITETFLVIPRFALALVLVSLYGQRIEIIIVVLSLISWPQLARMLRAETMSLKEREFVEASKSIGESNASVMFRDILPNATFVVVVNISIEVAAAILIETGLSYLGVGDPNFPTWGMMLKTAQDFLRTAWWLSVLPGVAVFLTVMGFNLVGDGLNDALNPKLKGR